MNRIGEELSVGACARLGNVDHFHVYRTGVAEYVVTAGDFGTIKSIHKSSGDAWAAAYELNEGATA